MSDDFRVRGRELANRRPSLASNARDLGRHDTSGRSSACRPRLVLVEWREPLLHGSRGHIEAAESVGRPRNRGPQWRRSRSDHHSGTATVVTDPDELERVSVAYGEKYRDPATGNRASVDPKVEVVFQVAVKRVQAWSYANAATQTVWEFG